MIVCICKGVSERAIRRVLDDGCVTVREVAKQCGAGSDCGNCLCDIEEMLKSTPYKPQD